MKVKFIAPSGEEYTFTEPRYIKIVTSDGDREIIYWFKHGRKCEDPLQGWYANKEAPKEL